jgi:hypothetical protein
MMSAAEEAKDLKANPLPPEPNCGTCLHCYRPEVSCELRDQDPDLKSNACDYKPDEDHDDTLPPLEQAYRVWVHIQALQEELSEYQNRYSALIEKSVAAKIETEGPYSLIDKKRTVRVPDVELFKSMFPQDYTVLKQEEVDRQAKKLDELKLSDLVSIPVKRAEELIGKVKLTKISDEKVYHNYSVLFQETKPCQS